MSHYPDPCETCPREQCVAGGCLAWKIRYLYRQKQINAWAKKHNVKPVSPPLKNPCDTCENEDCHTICKPRAMYWDAAMKKIRKALNGGSL